MRGRSCRGSGALARPVAIVVITVVGAVSSFGALAALFALQEPVPPVDTSWAIGAGLDLATPAAGAPVSVPSSIDSSGATDASAALATFIQSVPDGRTIAFRSGGTYRLDDAIHLVGRHDLVFAGNGATLRIAGCRVEDSAFLLDGTPSTNIVIRDFTMVGDNGAAGTTGAFVAGCESQMGVAIYGARDIEIANVTVSSVHAECVYIDAGGNPRGVGGWADNVYFHDSTCRLNGRMGV